MTPLDAPRIPRDRADDALFFARRFLLWLLVLRVAFLKAKVGEVIGLAAEA